MHYIVSLQLQNSEMDYISNLPDGIIESILCLIPIKEAARTSILTKEWRYKWTKLPKLVFDVDTFLVSVDGDEYTLDPMSSLQSQWSDWRHKYLKAVKQVMLMHQGPVHEFTLSVGFEDLDPDESCDEIYEIIRQLSKHNTSETKLAINLDMGWRYKLPLSLFPMHQLTDLSLCQCHLVLQPELFNGFTCLTSLSLENVQTSPETLLHLVATCPLLKSFTLNIGSENLHDVDNSTLITDLFKSLPLIETLTVYFDFRTWFNRVPEELPNALIHLKNIHISMGGRAGLYCVGVLIRSSPNLVKLTLDIWHPIRHDEYEVDSLLLEACSNVCMNSLSEVVIFGFSISKTQMAFMKFILAKSPALKKLIILHIDKDHNEALKISNILLCSPRASSEVKIAVQSG